MALDFVSYRSSLNTRPHPFATPSPSPPPEGTGTDYTFQALPGKPLAKVNWVGPLVPPERATRYDFIGQDKNVNVKMQPLWLMLSGGVAVIDNEHIRNAVFERVEIHYSGLAVILENAIFINCTFVLDNSDRSRQLAERLLAASPVNFSVGGIATHF